VVHNLLPIKVLLGLPAERSCNDRVKYDALSEYELAQNGSPPDAALLKLIFTTNPQKSPERRGDELIAG
jgi:hypothetical protein